jgi:hypothetical protein
MPLAFPFGAERGATKVCKLALALKFDASMKGTWDAHPCDSSRDGRSRHGLSHTAQRPRPGPSPRLPGDARDSPSREGRTSVTHVDTERSLEGRRGRHRAPGQHGIEPNSEHAPSARRPALAARPLARPRSVSSTVSLSTLADVHQRSTWREVERGRRLLNSWGPTSEKAQRAEKNRCMSQKRRATSRKFVLTREQLRAKNQAHRPCRSRL